jgi:hypothetical protein
VPNALGIGATGLLQVRDQTGRPVHVGGRQLRVLLILLALDAGSVVPVGSMAGQLWPEDPPGNPGNALQTLVSRLHIARTHRGPRHCQNAHNNLSARRLCVPGQRPPMTTVEREQASPADANYRT